MRRLLPFNWDEVGYSSKAEFQGRGARRDQELARQKRELVQVKKERDVCATRRRTLPRNPRAGYATIQRCRFDYPVPLVYRCLKAPTSTYDAWANQTPSTREWTNARLIEKIFTLHADNDDICGAPQITQTPQFENQALSGIWASTKSLTPGATTICWPPNDPLNAVYP